MPHVRSRHLLLCTLVVLAVLLLMPSLALAIIPSDGGLLPKATRLTLYGPLVNVGMDNPLLDWVHLWNANIDGGVVCAEREETNYREEMESDVVIYDLKAGTATPVAVSPNLLEGDGCIGDGIVAYRQRSWSSPVTYDVLAWDLSTGATTNLTADTDAVASDPVTGGGLVVWRAQTSDQSVALWGCKLATNDVRLICTGAWGAATNGSQVVYQTRDGINAYDWSTSSTRQLFSGTTPGLDGDSPDISGNHVVFEAWVDGELDVYYYDLTSNVLRRLELPNGQLHARVSGDYVSFWDPEMVYVPPEESENGEEYWYPEYRLAVWDLTSDTVYRAPIEYYYRFLSQRHRRQPAPRERGRRSRDLRLRRPPACPLRRHDVQGRLHRVRQCPGSCLDGDGRLFRRRR